MSMQRALRAITPSLPSFIPVQTRLPQPVSGVNQPGAMAAPAIVHDVLRSSGQSLEPEARAELEARLGHDFSQVRVHTDVRAAESASTMHSRAYTVGRDIVFAAGEYAPETTSGRRLLAHELAHVVQQSGSLSEMEPPLPASLPLSDGQSSMPEAEAESAARAVANGQQLTTALGHHEPSLQRQEASEEETRRWMGAGRQPMYQLHLDPQIEAQAMAFRLRGLLDPETIRLSLSHTDLDAIIGAPPPPWLTTPTVPTPGPLVPRGAGPETPRPATAGDVFQAVLRIPAVDTALTNLQAEATGRLTRDWRSLTTGGKVAVITQSALIGGGALAGVLSNPEARTFVLGQLQDRSLPTGVPGLNFQFNLTGPEQRVKFDLNVGALLPSSWGFR
jgi:Domain of unknown function (DUF4157)